ncbi:MAG TPA: hypothetical protein VIM75_18665 [Ohtaekwangia sp.]|uniref:hypothetical protein n=1 Tax=Ohtaekwangia sp. TaxID=2066019 RepID=UPI002F94AAC4
MKNHITSISILELRKLLYELRDRKANVCFRVRMIGEMWRTNFLKIFELTENGAVLIDCVTNQPVIIHDLGTIMQVEFDQRYQQYEPYFHYAVNSSNSMYRESKDILVSS